MGILALDGCIGIPTGRESRNDQMLRGLSLPDACFWCEFGGDEFLSQYGRDGHDDDDWLYDGGMTVMDEISRDRFEQRSGVCFACQCSSLSKAGAFFGPAERLDPLSLGKEGNL